MLRVFPDEGKVLVEHVMMVKKHVRPNPQRNIKGGIAEQESRDRDFEREAGLPDLRPGAHRTRSPRRPQGARLQEVRNDAGQVASSRYQIESSRTGNAANRLRNRERR